MLTKRKVKLLSVGIGAPSSCYLLGGGVKALLSYNKNSTVHRDHQTQKQFIKKEYVHSEGLRAL